MTLAVEVLELFAEAQRVVQLPPEYLLERLTWHVAAVADSSSALEWKRAHPERARAHQLAWKRRHPERVKAADKAYYQRRDKTKKRELNRAWWAKNKDRINAERRKASRVAA